MPEPRSVSFQHVSLFRSVIRLMRYSMRSMIWQKSIKPVAGPASISRISGRKVTWLLQLKVKRQARYHSCRFLIKRPESLFKEVDDGERIWGYSVATIP